MKHSAAKFMCALFTTVAVSVLQGPAVARQQRPRLIFAKVNSKALEGNLVEDPSVRNVTIYLPPGYYTRLQQKYPVVYLLHGYTGNNLLWTGKGYCGEELDIAHIADELIANGLMRPMILVAPDCSNKYGGSWYTNSQVTGGWEDFVTKELVQYVDDNYRTLATTESRGIAGHSMGGHGALKLAMRRPDVYGAVYAMSPAFPIFHESIVKRLRSRVLKAWTLKNWDDFKGLGEDWLTQAVMAAAVAVAPNPNKPPFYADFPLDRNGDVIEKVWRRWQQHDLFTMVGTERYQDNLRRLRGLRIDCGTDDTRLIAEDGLLSKALHSAEVPHVYEEYPGDHINRVAERLCDKVLPFFSGTLTFGGADSAQAMQGSPPAAGGLLHGRIGRHRMRSRGGRCSTFVSCFQRRP